MKDPSKYNFHELIQVEAREERGEPLTVADRRALEYARAKVRPLIEAARRAFVEYEDEFAYMKALRGARRRRFEHLTLRQIRRMRVLVASYRRPCESGRSRERRLVGRRAASSSSTSSSDPGDPEPEQLVLNEAELRGRLSQIAASLRAKGGMG